LADPVMFQEPNLKNPNETNSVWFEWITEKNDAESEKQGMPVFDKVLLAHIIGPGLVKSEAVMACERHKPDEARTIVVNPVATQRYGQMIEAFKKGETDGLTGTPLTELAALDMGMRASLLAMKVHSIEGLAAMNETAAPGLMGFRKYKMAAQAYLEQRAGQAPLAKITAELDRVKSEKDLLQARFDDLAARVTEMENAKEEKRGPGRPPKIAAAA